MKNILLVIFGGGLGSGFRYFIHTLAKKHWEGIFPFGTLLINVIGSLIIGLLLGYFTKNAADNEATKLLLITGFCGGFTTFSTFAAENLNLIETNQIGLAMLYIGASIFLGIVAVWAGFMLMKL